MSRIIKVRTAGADSWEVKEVDLQEAQRILENTYADEAGGLVVNAKTMEVIWQIEPDVDEILVMPEMLIAGG